MDEYGILLKHSTNRCFDPKSNVSYLMHQKRFKNNPHETQLAAKYIL